MPDDTDIPDDINSSNTTGNVNGTVNAYQCGGALGIYRITLWIIVMTITIFSMMITQRH